MGRMISIAVAIVTPETGIGFKFWCWCGYFYFLDKYFISFKVLSRNILQGVLYLVNIFLHQKPRNA